MTQQIMSLDLSQLNPSQCKAVEAPPGYWLIIAGPGTGKTMTLTYRIVYLILKLGVNPEEILAITFTQKAAEEIQSRVHANARIIWGAAIDPSMDKSVRVEVERMIKDATFMKYLRRRKSFMAHDEKNDCKKGDRVEIVESRPISKNKKWVVSKVLERALIEE